jgi:hypothetical protein
MVFFFWPSLLIVLYTFVGYGIVLFVLAKTLRFFKGGRNVHYNIDSLPTFTLIIASGNDAGVLREKISNTFALKYPNKKYFLRNAFSRTIFLLLTGFFRLVI